MKLAHLTRDLAIGNGSQYFMGLPFKPASARLNVCVNDSPQVSIGEDDSVTGQCVYGSHAANPDTWRVNALVSVILSFGSASYATAKIGAMHPGGFRLDWGGAGQHNGVATLLVSAEKDESYTAPVTPVVLMGDSITALWPQDRYVAAYNRGIAGEETAQMAARFSADVLSLNPSKVVILGGTNDVTRQEHPNADHIAQMANAAIAAGAAVVLCKIPPIAASVQQFSVPTFNGYIASVAATLGVPCVDYYTPMLLNGVQNTALFVDTAHPNIAGYNVMWDALKGSL